MTVSIIKDNEHVHDKRTLHFPLLPEAVVDSAPASVHNCHTAIHCSLL